MSHVTEKMLPELPASRGFIQWHSPQAVNQAHGYTSTQMHDYARAALEAALSQGEAVDYQYRFWNESANYGKGRWSSWDRISRDDYEREHSAPVEGREVRALYTHPKPAPQSEPAGDHALARAVEKALGNRDGERDSELDELLAMAMQELNAIDTSLADEQPALAATGKQSGSDRAGFDAWAARTGMKNVHGFNRIEDMWDAWQAATASRETLVVVKPDPALLVSMAVRLHHGFGLLERMAQNRILVDMGKVWEEVAGIGYYKPESANVYLSMLAKADSEPQCDSGAGVRP